MAGCSNYSGCLSPRTTRQLVYPSPAIVVTRPFGSSIRRAQDAECPFVEVDKTQIFFGGANCVQRVLQSLMIKNSSRNKHLELDLAIEGTNNFWIKAGSNGWVQICQLTLIPGEEYTIHLGFLPKDLSGKLEKAKLLLRPLFSVQRVPPQEVDLSGYAGSSNIQVKVKPVASLDLLHKHYILELENIGQLESYAVIELFRSDGVNMDPAVKPNFFMIPPGNVEKVSIIFPSSFEGGIRYFAQVYWGDELLRLRWKSCIDKGLKFTNGSNWHKFRFPSLNDWEEKYADLMSSEDDMQLFYDNLKTPIVELLEENQVDLHSSRTRAGSLNLPLNHSLPTMTRLDQLCLLNQPSLGSSSWLSKSTGSALSAVDSFRCSYERSGCKKVFLEKVGASSHALFNCPFSPKSTVAQHRALLQHPF